MKMHDIFLMAQYGAINFFLGSYPKMAALGWPKAKVVELFND